ncbi:helix-turn-helix domain-containing protein [Pseudonocardia oroxyli]|uniref:helix-turn-helix domain-containing protein n=1 Tax=Pseudonocardia oroxyli TaxID=366584 RepID=UPI000B85862A
MDIPVLLSPNARRPHLRQTLRVFLSEGRSATAAARLLHCHKNTVIYRIGVIQRLLDRPIADAHRDLDLALHAGRWLGGSVLQHPASE